MYLEKENHFQFFISSVDRLGERVMAIPWEREEVYAQFLAQTYYYVRHTTNLVCLAAIGYGPDQRKEHYGAIHHLNEETNHDEMAYRDLQTLGWNLETELPELVETSLFYQNQYYVIPHLGPSSHLGYSLVLEGLASKFGPAFLQHLLRYYPRDACRFVEAHSILDQDHYGHGIKKLEHLNQNELRAVRINLEQSVFLYERMLDRIANQLPRQKRTAA